MAFTPDEKAQIKKRAQELVADGMAAGQAAQAAASELFTQDEILQRFSPPEVTETRSPDVQRVDTELKDAETDFRRERTRQLETQGIEPEVVEETVRQELEQYRAPAPLGFGSPQEREDEDYGVPFSPAALTEGRRTVTPIGEQQEPTGINYEVIGEQFAESFGTSKEEGIADAYAFRDLIVEPRLRDIRTRGGSGALIDDEVTAIEEGFGVLTDLYERMQDKDRYIQPPSTDRASSDVWIRTFSKRTDIGEGVPDLTPQQIQFLNARENRRIQNVIGERVGDAPTKMVIISETGEETPFERGTRPGSIPDGSRVETRPLTRDEIAEQVFEEEADALPWWMDPQKKVEVIANPQEFEERGFLSTTTPYGTMRESTGNYLLRSALTIPNVLAGAVGAAAYGAGGLGTERAAKREAKGFSPDIGGAILQNVAENRGFFGEAQEAADITGLTGVARYATLAGGFAGDILDPSLDIIKGLTTAGVVGRQTSRAIGRVSGASRLGRFGPAAQAGMQAGIRDFLDSSVAGSLIEWAYKAKTGKTLVAGDPRAVAGRLLSDEYEAILSINADSIAGRSSEEILRNLDEAELGGTQMYNLLARELEENGGDIVAAFNSAVKVAAKNNKSVRELGVSVDEILKGKLKSIPKNEIQQLLGTMAKNDEQFAAMLRQADEMTTGAASSRLALYVAETMANPRYRSLFFKGIASSKAMKDVFEATAGMETLGKLVALTRNTYAGKGAAKEIMNIAKDSDIAKVAKELAKDSTPRFVGVRESVIGTAGSTAARTADTPARVVAAFDVNDETAQRIINSIEELRKFNRISDEVANPIISRIRDGKFVTTRDLRTIIDAEIDAIAAARAAKDSKSVIKSSDISRLPVSNQLALLEPLESRTFVKSALRKIYEFLTGRKIARGNLSIGQRQLLQRAQEELQGLDIKLRKDMKRLLSDPEFRAVYEAENIGSRSDALAHLIVGPRTTEELQESATFLANTERLSREMNELDSAIEELVAPYGTTMEDIRAAQDIIRESKRSLDSIIRPIELRTLEIQKTIDNLQTVVNSRSPSSFAAARKIRENRALIDQNNATIQEATQRYNEAVAQLPNFERIVDENPNIVDLLERRERVVSDIVHGGLPSPRPTRSKNLNSLIDSLIENMFVADETLENVFDVFVGTSRVGNNSVLTLKGKELLATNMRYASYDEMLKDIAQTVNFRPSELWEQLIITNQLYNKMILDIKMAEAATGKANEIFRFPLSSIKPTFIDGKIPQEWQVAAYYRAQAQNISNDLLADVINKELRDTNFRLENVLSDGMIEQVGRLYSELAALTNTQLLRPQIENPINTSSILQNRLNRIGRNDELYPVSEELSFDDIAEMFPFAKLEQYRDSLSGSSVTRIGRGGTTDDFIQLVEELIARPENASVLRTLSEAGDDIAQAIVRKNGYTNTTPSIDAMERIVSDLNSDDIYNQLRLMYGEDVAEQLRTGFEESFDKIRKDTLALIDKRNATGSEKLKNTARDIYEGFLNLRYTILLNMRPRFHGANLITGADIYYKTTGRVPDFRDIYEGGKVLLNRNPNAIIFTDPAGRAFTSDELNDILLKATGRTVYGLDLPQAKAKRLRNLISDMETKAGRTRQSVAEAIDIFKELPQYEDLLFRYAALKAALREGRSMDDAVALAKRSMFDASNITDAEMRLKNIALFYGFARQNLVTTAENMLTVRGIKRLAQAARTVNNLNQVFTDKETAQYSPSYTQTRIILDKIDFDPDKGKSLIIASAPLASLDGVYVLADFLKLQPQGFVGGAVRPEFKSLLGIEDKFDRDFTRVPPEHIAILDSLGFDAGDVINLIVGGLGGEQVIPVPVSEERETIEGSYNGVIYPLSTPKQKAAYKRFFDIFSLIGSSTLLSDIPRSLSAEGTRVKFVGEQMFPDNELLGRLSSGLMFGTAIGTPYVSMSPERQAYYDRLSRLRELRGVNAAIRTEENRRMREEAPPEAIEQQEEIQEARQEIQQRRAIEPSRSQRTKIEIAREIRTIKVQLRSGQIDPATARSRLLELRDEYRALPQ